MSFNTGQKPRFAAFFSRCVAETFYFLNIAASPGFGEKLRFESEWIKIVHFGKNKFGDAEDRISEK
ncbi:hypothetical protein SDC9_68864 [bioreactor metagenome]|uniref:Uncharacterized protein n=1 Tax=bioreactor metagenome TaxID=1076179 RepID=A0A644Y234_9ZZZZ